MTDSQHDNASGKRGGGGLAILALLIALAAGGASGYLWYQLDLDKKARLSASQELDTRLEQAIQTVADAQEADLKSLQAALDEQRTRVQELAGGGDTNKNNIVTLQDEAQLLKGEIQSLQGDIQSLNSALELQKGSMEIQKTENQNLQADVRSLQTDIQSMQGEMQAAKGRIDAQNDAIQARQAEIQGLQSDDQALDDKLLSLRGEVQSLATGIQALQGENQTRQAEIQEGQSIVQSVQGAVKSLEGELQSVNAEIQAQKVQGSTRQTEIAALQDEIQAQKSNLVTLQDQVSGAVEKQQSADAQANSRIDNLQLGLRGLLNTLEAVKAVAARGGDVNAFALSEVEYLLRIAEHQLELDQNVGAAVQALEVAEKRLVRVDESAFSAVERMIGENIAALRAVDLPDIAALINEILELERGIDSLPLRIDIKMGDLKEKVKPPISKGEAAAPESSWVEQLTTSAWGELKDIVVIRNERSSGPPLIAVEEEYFLAQNLRLELDTIRFALIRRDAVSYQSSIDKARQWVETYFDTDDAQVANIVAELNNLKTVQLNPYIPDLSGMLRAFQDVMERREPIRSVAAPTVVETPEQPVVEQEATPAQTQAEEPTKEPTQ